MFDILFPKYCINCGYIGDYLCEKCIKKFKNTLPECYICRRISNGYITHHNCNKNNIEKVFVGWEYNDLAKKLLAQYKYRYAYRLSEIIADLLIKRLINTGFAKNITTNTLLLPIPIHNNHYKDRGFNQSLLIGENLAKYFHCDIDTDLIERVGNSNYQSQKTLQDRLALESNIFKIKDKKEIKNKDIIIIDDVISTGTTLNRLSKILGRNNLSAIALFRGKPHYQFLEK